jgi:bifunctional UDP-N-acetylglucosamine pyrophosphorylase / glucosamine-1-phosphate N-acetyltransferase
MKNQIVILAAGKGTRMGNSRVPKVLVMLNQKPLILHQLHELEKITQLAKPVIVVGYMAEKVRGVLGSHYLYAYQDKQLGTAHALLAAKQKVKAENILVLYGDMPFIKSEALGEFIKMHLHSGGKMSMMTAQVENFRGKFKSLEHYGRVLRGALHNIVGIVEFKDATDVQRKIKEINPGIYMFNTKWLWDNLKKIGNQNKQQEYYLTDILAVAMEQGEKIRSLSIPAEQILGVNSKEDLEIAERILTK